jgi:ligand-binding sensor protein
MIDVQELAQIQDYTAKAIGFAAVITDPEGKPITHQSNFSKACEMFHRPIAGTLCEALHKALGEESLDQGGVVIRQCDHGGLSNAAV